MQAEAWEMVPRKDRPLPEQLEGYERKFDYDPDYTSYRVERAEWLHDFRREEEQKRERDAKGRELLPGGDPDNFLVQGGRRGFDPATFDLQEVNRTVKSRPRH